MSMTIDEVRDLLTAAWSRVVSREKALYVTAAVIDAVLEKDSRMNPLSAALDDIEESLAAPPRFNTILDKGASLLIDWNGTSPYGHMLDVHTLLRERARTHGVVSLALRNTAGIHQLSTWVAPLATDGEHLALFAWNGGSYTVAPFGSREPFFGTNPIAFAIPTATMPLVCDMATSEVPFLSLMTALKSGGDLPYPAGLNADGNRTAVAKEIYDPNKEGPVRLLPMGMGYKGSAIMLLVEVLTGAMIGAKMSREATDEKFVPAEFGGWFQVWHLPAFCNATDFATRVSRMCDQIRASTPAAGLSQILLPGDAAHERRQLAIARNMLHLAHKDESRLRQLAQK